ncbi:MAG: alanine--tRNA ligase [Thermodesulfobacteriota bacterium]|nr:alanine--tRNA ligase [Candidatus Dadabacteria bacterium]|tara:strand:- start:38892 stop:41492 length:2601 start_codon:yes stop_codon:yes gene_type:complete
MLSADIRKKFLNYFKSHNHSIIESSSLIPTEDPTLLFTNAGMVQFKDIFLGEETRDYSTACSCQKSLRAGGKHNDLENVGQTRRHHTFFEMLGNFSFGDYFKEDAIQFAWEFLTIELKLNKEKLFVTVFNEDDEAERIWTKYIDKERIFRLGEEDNFWSMGDTGPCGPCSEIIYDMGDEPEKNIDITDGERYLEIWNLVFMQFNRDEKGKMTPLPKPSIDTGMGLERLASILQGVSSNYDTDLFKYLIEYSASKKGVPYNTDSAVDISYRVLADHTRAATFLISDGVMPSSEGRGYVLRRILRRAIRHCRLLGIDEPFIFELSNQVIDFMKPFYVELEKNKENIMSIIKNEEEKFLQTIDRGLDQLNSSLELSKATKVLSGKDIFKLYDTFGFPVDLIEDILKSTDYTMDIQGYEEEMLEQKKSSKVASKFKAIISDSLNLNDIGKKITDGFVGYNENATDSLIVGIVKDNELVTQVKEGDKVSFIFDKTPFYAESGGQISDKGIGKKESGIIEIFNVQKTKDNFYLHQSIVKKGIFKLGDKLVLEINTDYRFSISSHHSATHIIHYALRNILGTHVRQAGSLVEDSRLRFDFSHFNNIDDITIKSIERLCNEKIIENSKVTINENVEYKKAIKEGANAFFEEKYGDLVRVVKIGDYSMELCGGTHVKSSGDLGSITISSENSISSGIRRIEAYTSIPSYNFLLNLRDKLNVSSRLLSASLEKVPDEIERLKKENIELKHKIIEFEKSMSKGLASQLKEDAVIIEGVKVISFLTNDMTANELKSLWDELKEGEAKAIGLLGSNNQSNSILICASTNEVDNFDCKEVMSLISKSYGGKGGGKKNLAQAGFNNISSIDEGLEIIKTQL